MSITQGICWSYLLEREQAIHSWGTDTFKIALFTASASLSPSGTTAYAATNEITGAGYVAGGAALVLTGGYPQLSALGNVLWDFTDSAWAGAFTTNPRAALVYNSSKANRAVGIIDFGMSYAVTTSFSIVWPVATDFSAIFRSAGAR